jgi:hypothetical protein
VVYGFTTRYARTYTSLVTLAYVLGLVLSFLMPHPFPPTRLFMAIVSAVIDRAQMDPADATALGFATFASATATSMILLTGNSLLHPVIIGFAGVPVSWLAWVGLNRIALRCSSGRVSSGRRVALMRAPRRGVVAAQASAARPSSALRMQRMYGCRVRLDLRQQRGAWLSR